MQKLDNGTVVDANRGGCASGNATFDYNSASSGFELIEGQWLGDQYGSGNVYGIVGYEDVQLGSIELKQQQVGVVNISRFVFDGISTGLLALGYPSITFVHPNSFSLNQTLYGNVSLIEHRIRYPTVFERLMEEGMEGYVCLALERTRLHEEIGFGSYSRSSSHRQPNRAEKLTPFVSDRGISRSWHSSASSPWPLRQYTSRNLP